MATFEETLDKAIEVAVKRAILKAHPVGSLYLSLTDENPSISLGGGTWVKVGSGKCLWGADSSHAVGTEISAGLPNATGAFSLRGFDNGWSTIFNDASGVCSVSRNGASEGAFLNGGSKNANRETLTVSLSRGNPIYGASTTVQPPALAVNIWKRTA